MRPREWHARTRYNSKCAPIATIDFKSADPEDRKIVARDPGNDNVFADEFGSSRKDIVDAFSIPALVIPVAQKHRYTYYYDDSEKQQFFHRSHSLLQFIRSGTTFIPRSPCGTA